MGGAEGPKWFMSCLQLRRKTKKMTETYILLEDLKTEMLLHDYQQRQTSYQV